jgi:uncharacterized protein YjbJ (UPF0337 family)
MDWNRIEGNWKQAQGKIKEKWGKLTDDDLTKINGQREQLEGIIEQRYGSRERYGAQGRRCLVEEPAVNRDLRAMQTWR